MGLEEGFKFKKKKSIKPETTKLENIETEGEVEVYGLEAPAPAAKPAAKPNTKHADTECSAPKKLKIPIIKLKEV